MRFELNGEMHEADRPISVRALLDRFGLCDGRVAVAINAEVVPRCNFDATTVRAGDRVEVIHAVGGG